MLAGHNDEIVGARFIIEVQGQAVEEKFDEAYQKHIGWPVRSIYDHEGPLEPGDKNYDGYPVNIKVKWSNVGRAAFDPTWERLDDIAVGASDVCFEYAKKRGLLKKAGWEFLDENNEAEDESSTTSESVASQFDEDNQYESDNGDGHSSDSDYHDDSREDEPICVSQDSSDTFDTCHD